MRARVRCGLKDKEGSALLETMISLLTAMWLAFGLFELCMFTYTAVVLNYAAGQGVRYAIMHGTDSADCSGPDNSCPDKSYAYVKSAVISAASACLHNISGMTVTVDYAGNTAKPGSPVTVELVYTYVPYLSLFGLQKTMTFNSQGEIIF